MKVYKIISIFLLITSIYTTSYTQDLQVLLDSSTYYWNQEQYTKAYNMLNIAVETSKKEYEAQTENSASNYAYILNQMGVKLYMGESYEVAATYYNAAIPIYQDLQGENGNDYLVTIENLAVCLNADSKFEDALYFYNHLLSNETFLANSGSNVFQTYNTAGIAAYQMDDYETAKSHYLKALNHLTTEIPDYWVIVENLILLEQRFGQYAEGYIYLNPFLEKFPDKKKEYTNLLAYYYRDLGNTSFEEGNYNDAISNLKKTLKYIIEEDSIDRITKVYALEGIASAFINTRNFKGGLPYFIENEKSVKAHYGEKSDEYLISLNYLSLAYTEQGEYQKGNQIYKQAYKIIGGLGIAKRDEFKSLFDVNYADYLIKLGKFSEAKTYAFRAFEFYNKDNEKYFDDMVYSMNQIGILLTSTGEYEKAESQFMQTLNLQKEQYGLENPMSSNIASNLTSLYIQTGRTSRATQFLLFILSNDYKIHGEKSYEYSFSLQVAGVLYTSSGENELAIDAFKKAYEIRKSLVGNNNRELLRLKQSLGTSYLKAGELDEAEKLLTEILEIQIRTLESNHFDVSLTQNDLALVYFARKEYSKARKLFDKSYSIKKKVLGQYNQFTVTSLYNIACTDLQTNDLEKAFINFNQSIKDYLFILDKYFPYLSEKERLEYYHTIKGQVSAYFSFLNTQLETHPEYASILYNTQIKTKSILLSESMKLRNFLSNHKDENVQNAYKKWISINEEIAKMGQIPLDNEKQIYLDSIKIVGEEFERILNSLSGASDNSKNISWQDIAAKLQDGEVAVELVRVKSFDFENNKTVKEKAVYLALIIDNKTTNYPKYIRLKEGFSMDSKYFNVYKNAMKFKVKDERSYNEFWKPIAEQVSTYSKIYLSSDGVYHLINLNTLYNPATSKYVINESNIEIVGNTSELIEKTQENKKAENAVLFGFPSFNISPDINSHDSLRTTVYRDIFTNGVSDLPGTKVEVANINSLMTSFGIKTKTHTAHQAHEQQLKSIHSVDILHIATHGFFEESTNDLINDDPLMHAGLLLANIKELANMQEENGIITAKEVAQLDLQNNKLVVLSACETGRGKVVDGEGVYGLQRAFQVAGADNVIISLWKVDDTATQLLMTYFYKEYLLSYNPRTALKQAQIKLQEEYPHPNYWGAFYVVGK